MRDERFVKPTGPDWITGEAGRQRMVTDRELDSFANVGSHLDLREQSFAELSSKFKPPQQQKAGPMVSDSELDKFEAQARASAKRLGLYGGRDEEAFGKSPGQGGYSY
jgi:hypothetical protein